MRRRNRKVLPFRPRPKWPLRSVPVAAVLLALALVAWVAFEAGLIQRYVMFSSPAFIGTATLVDGDTIKIRGNRIRLFGIDAPERRQICINDAGDTYRCGQVATEALRRKIGGRLVSCDHRGTDRYGRAISKCWVDDNSLNSWLVSQGLAVAYTRYSVRYLPEEAYARVMGRGLWSGEFDRPTDWRKQNR